MIVEKSSKVVKKFYCEVCDYECCRKYDFDKHLSTRKHKMIVNDSKMIVEKSSTEYDCVCGKNYKHSSNYYRHKKNCTFIEEKEENTIVQNTQNSGGVDKEFYGQIIDKIINPLVNCHNDMIKKQDDMVKTQNDLTNIVVTQQQQMIEIIPKIGNTMTSSNNNSHNNNSNNNNFNMKIYLNEKCKDAMTLTDFIDNLKISDADFETTRTEGIVSGLTDIFTNELRELDVRKLPIHCSDIRRETFYIKEEDEWVKDDCKKSILSRAIDKAKGKANKFLPAWIDDHPNCWKSDSPYHLEWMNVVTIRFGDGDPKFNEKNTKKILKNIAAEVLIDKETAMIDE